MAKEPTQKEEVVKQAEKPGFRKLSELSDEEILALPRVEMKVVHFHNDNYGTDRYNCYVYFFKDQLELRFPIDRSTFFLIGLLRGKQVGEKNSYSISFPYRMVKGRADSEKDGHEFDYYYCEGYACPKQRKVYLNCLLKGSQVDLLVNMGLAGIVDRGFVGHVGEVSYFDDLG